MGTRSKASIIKGYLKTLKELQRSDDPESAHMKADDLLLAVVTAYGEDEVVEVYRKLRNSLPFYYA